MPGEKKKERPIHQQNNILRKDFIIYYNIQIKENIDNNLLCFHIHFVWSLSTTHQRHTYMTELFLYSDLNSTNNQWHINVVLNTSISKVITEFHCSKLLKMKQNRNLYLGKISYIFMSLQVADERHQSFKHQFTFTNGMESVKILVNIKVT